MTQTNNEREAIIEAAKNQIYKQEFGKWADEYALDHEPLTSASRRYDCYQAYLAGVQAARQSNNVPVAVSIGNVSFSKEHNKWTATIVSDFGIKAGTGLYTSPQQTNALEMAAKLAKAESILRHFVDNSYCKDAGSADLTVTTCEALEMATAYFKAQPEITAPKSRKQIGWYAQASEKFINNESALLAYPSAVPAYIEMAQPESEGKDGMEQNINRPKRS